jgi:hypothetical protein
MWVRYQCSCGREHVLDIAVIIRSGEGGAEDEKVRNRNANGYFPLQLRIPLP